MKIPLRFALLFAICAMSGAAQAAGPQPPCGSTPTPAFPAPGAAPAIAVWHDSDLEQSKWQPPACTGWPGGSQSRLLIALAGSFRHVGSIDPILSRIAAISTLRSVRYWSTTDKKWRSLANAASALSGPNATDRRPDFAASELRKAATLYYWEDDSRSGEIVTRMSVLERTPDRAVIGTENITPVRTYLITMFPPGALQSVLFIQRIAPAVWGVYLLSRSLQGTSMLAGGHEASYVNRALALYRQMAGIRTDEEPPARQ